MVSATPARPGSDAATLPPLESGDRLSAREFWRLYEQRPDIKKAELIDGVAYVASPVRMKHHGTPHSILASWHGAYWIPRQDRVLGGDNGTVLLDGDNVLQPDLCLWYDRPGRLDEHGYFVGAPDLVIEIAASSASIDLHDKLRVYRRNGVQEYLVWDVHSEAVHWWQLVEGDYEPLPVDADGVIESVAFPGLRLPVAALLARDGAAVLAAVR